MLFITNCVFISATIVLCLWAVGSIWAIGWRGEKLFSHEDQTKPAFVQPKAREKALTAGFILFVLFIEFLFIGQILTSTSHRSNKEDVGVATPK